MKLVWDESAWADYVWWQVQDRKVLKRINTLITDIQRNGNEGIGKPEPLKHGFQGYWSRRITDEHRLVYKIVEAEIRIAACRYHYERLGERAAEGGTAGQERRCRSPGEAAGVRAGQEQFAGVSSGFRHRARTGVAGRR